MSLPDINIYMFSSNHTHTFLLYISNRALDSLPATMDVLQTIVHAVNGQLEVFMDGGIRSGMDVFKALAYGRFQNLSFINTQM